MKPRATTLPPEWKQLTDAYGGVCGFANALGKHYTSIGKWAKGEAMSDTTRILIQRLAQDKGLRPPWDYGR